MSMFDSGVGRLVVGLGALLVVMLALAKSVPVAEAQSVPPARDFFGVVVAVENSALLVSVTDDVIRVETDGDTVIRVSLRRDAVLADILEGDLVAVSLKAGDRGSVASQIFVIPGKTQFRHVPGTVTALSTTSIRIQPVGGASPVTFGISPDTRINYHRGATQLIEGVFVVILAARNEDSGALSATALEINVTPDRPQVRPTIVAPAAPGTLKNTTRIRGVFESLDSDGNWIVSGTLIQVDSHTEVDSGLVVGRLVEVFGAYRDDGSILAIEIEAREEADPNVAYTRFEGVFGGLERGAWLVSGTPVVIVEGTDTDGVPTVGQRVRVKAIIRPDGSVVAREVENLRSDGAARTGGSFEIDGVFQGIDGAGHWKVNGLLLSVNEDTRIEGDLEEGSRIEVKAAIQNDGSLLAEEVELRSQADRMIVLRREVEIKGAVREVTLRNGVVRAVIVDSHRVDIDDLTEIEGQPVKGAQVEIKALISTGGNLVASSIEVKDATTSGESPPSVDIVGTIQTVQRIDVDRTVLIVDNLRVLIVVRTTVSGSPAVGASAKIEGDLQRDGTILARSVRIKQADDDESPRNSRFRGEIEEIRHNSLGQPESLVVSGRVVELSLLTRIETVLAVGLRVEVRQLLTAAGPVTREIRVVEEDEEVAILALEASESGDDQAEDGREVEIEGTIDQIINQRSSDQSIIVDGTIVHVVPGRTRIKDGRLTVGLIAEVKGTERNGDIVADEIKVKEPEESEPDAGRTGSGNGSSRR